MVSVPFSRHDADTYRWHPNDSSMLIQCVRTQLLETVQMSKSQDRKKEPKKKPAKTAEEKRAAKRARKRG